MKVNLTYSVELEEVPLEIDRVFRKTIEDLHRHLGQLENLDPTATLKFVDGINEFRKLLYDVDAKLENCHSMGMGYMRALGTSVSPPAEEPKEEEQNEDR
tara:strand:- start:478 stop:777 length:300 start_codon:yes stop_codon:yes gene_type:complete